MFNNKLKQYINEMEFKCYDCEEYIEYKQFKIIKGFSYLKSNQYNFVCLYCYDNEKTYSNDIILNMIDN